MLEYWRNPEATAKKFAGDWLLTGDLGRIDEDGYVFFKSRGRRRHHLRRLRIGPGEIEECLMKHPAVAMVGVVGVPDRLRTEIVKAFVQLRPEIAATEALKADLAGFVKTRLAAHEYPREVEFVTELPLTTTGRSCDGAAAPWTPSEDRALERPSRVWALLSGMPRGGPERPIRGGGPPVGQPAETVTLALRVQGKSSEHGWVYLVSVKIVLRICLKNIAQSSGISIQFHYR